MRQTTRNRAARLSPKSALRLVLTLASVTAAATLAAETWLVLSSQAVGLDLDVKGPFAALLGLAKQTLPSFVARVAAVYWLGAAVVGAAAVGASAAAGAGAVAAVLTHFGLLAAAVLYRAVINPALFDDLPGAARWLGPLVDHGEPWHAVAVVALVLLAVSARGPQRTRGLLLGVLLVAVSAAAVSRQPRFGAVAASHAPVILFGIDALRPDRLAALGGAGLTPHLDELVADATLFTRAYTPIAQTEPAWRSLLTSTYPARHGVRYSLIRAQERRPGLSVAQVFADAGWQTVFATDCSRFNFQDAASGFAERRQPPRGAINFLLEKMRFRGAAVFAPLGRWLVPELTENRALAGMVDSQVYAERLTADVLARAARGPLFYAYHATAAHFPGDPTYPFYRRRLGSDVPLNQRLRMFYQPVSEEGAAPPRGRDGQLVNEALYDALIMQADAQLGVLISGLREAGLYDAATLIVFSDHGEDFYHGRPTLEGKLSVHGAALGDEQNHAVLAVKLGRKSESASPRRAANKSLVTLLDIAPTLLDLAGLPALPEARGRSLVPALLGTGEGLPAETPFFAETAYTHALPSVFEQEHYTGARRSFDSYTLHPDGLVEVADATHQEIMREKDYGAFDGTRWLSLWRDRDGLLRWSCRAATPGACEDVAAVERLAEQVSDYAQQ